MQKCGPPLPNVSMSTEGRSRSSVSGSSMARSSRLPDGNHIAILSPAFTGVVPMTVSTLAVRRMW